MTEIIAAIDQQLRDVECLFAIKSNQIEVDQIATLDEKRASIQGLFDTLLDYIQRQTLFLDSLDAVKYIEQLDTINETLDHMLENIPKDMPRAVDVQQNVGLERQMLSEKTTNTVSKKPTITNLKAAPQAGHKLKASASAKSAGIKAKKPAPVRQK